MINAYEVKDTKLKNDFMSENQINKYQRNLNNHRTQILS